MKSHIIFEWLRTKPEGAGIVEVHIKFAINRWSAKGLLQRSGAVVIGASHAAVWCHPLHVATATAALRRRAAEKAELQRQRKCAARRAEHKRRNVGHVATPDGPVIRIISASGAPPIKTRAVRCVWELAA